MVIISSVFFFFFVIFGRKLFWVYKRLINEIDRYWPVEANCIQQSNGSTWKFVWNILFNEFFVFNELILCYLWISRELLQWKYKNMTEAVVLSHQVHFISECCSCFSLKLHARHTLMSRLRWSILLMQSCSKRALR